MSSTKNVRDAEGGASGPNDGTPKPVFGKGRGKCRGRGKVHEAAAYLRDGIFSQTFKAGEIIALKPLVSQLGMTVAPIRTAAMILVEDGLLEEVGNALQVRMIQSREKLDLLRVMMALETEAANYVAHFGRVDKLDELGKLVRQLRDASSAKTEAEKWAHWVRHCELHLLMAARQPFTRHSLDRLFGIFRLGFPNYMDDPSALTDDDERIVKAIKAHAIDEAKEAVRAHVSRLADRWARSDHVRFLALESNRPVS